MSMDDRVKNRMVIFNKIRRQQKFEKIMYKFGWCVVIGIVAYPFVMA